MWIAFAVVEAKPLLLSVEFRKGFQLSSPPVHAHDLMSPGQQPVTVCGGHGRSEEVARGAAGIDARGDVEPVERAGEDIHPPQRAIMSAHRPGPSK